MKNTTRNTIFCTIITKSHLAQGKVLARSIRRYHPNTKVYVLVIDQENRNRIDISSEEFEIVKLSEIPIPHRNKFLFQYTSTEASRNLKPFFLQYLLGKMTNESLVYLDSDILVTNSLSPVFGLLNRHAIILTPHITNTLPDDNCHPSEQDILSAGTYNGGFVALNNSSQSLAFTQWWSQKVSNYGFLKLDQWKSADQKWLNLAPTIFPKTRTLNTPGYNTGYWNIPTYTIDHEHQTYLINKNPLRFFHFSGYNPMHPNTISKHQNRISFHTHPQLKPLFANYRKQLLQAGYKRYSQLPYTHNYFDNKIKISPKIRDVFRKTHAGHNQSSNPFRAQADSFYAWLTTPVKPRSPITNLQYAIYKENPDLCTAYPNVLTKDAPRFLMWIKTYGATEYQLDKVFTDPATPLINTKTRIPFPLHRRALWHKLDQYPRYITTVKMLNHLRNRLR